MEAAVASLIVPPVWSLAPFALLLLCIALMPLLKPDWWHHHYPKVAAVFALYGLIYNLTLSPSRLGHTVIEYISFVSLMSALFIITGGIYFRGSLVGRPLTNTAILFIGAISASIIGTTGASMLLILPLIRANKFREHKTHLWIFYIFLVSNIGGALTPIGDPPLFMGFLQGIDFFWTFKLFPEYALLILILCSLFFVIDSYQFKKEKRPPLHALEPFRIEGTINFFFLGGVILTVLFFKPFKEAFQFPLSGEFFQIISMNVMAFMSYKAGPKGPRHLNQFNFAPIREVAFLFAGIFMCMMPALMLLEARGASLGLTQASHFFWSTGVLSAFLDNAPTYMTFLSVAKSLPETGVMIPLADGSSVPEEILKAISMAAVYFGACSYIGNGPNFMVKSIVEASGSKMPSFLGYMLWSVGILLPLFLGIELLFLH